MHHVRARQKVSAINNLAGSKMGSNHRDVWNTVQRERVQALLDEYNPRKVRAQDEQALVSSEKRYQQALSGGIYEPESVKKRMIDRTPKK